MGSVGVFVFLHSMCVFIRKIGSERKIVFSALEGTQTPFQSVSETFKNCSFISNMNVRNVSFAISVNLHLN